MEHYKLKRPDLTGSKINLSEFSTKFDQSQDFLKNFEATMSPEYRYWDKVRYLPRPEGWSAEEFWFAVKRMRSYAPMNSSSPVKTESDKSFAWLNLPTYQELLHLMDQNLGGFLGSEQSVSEQEKNRLVLKGIQEEAIASSLLEGASTTRKAAQKFLLEKRKPKTEADHMILNNYRTMEAINHEYQKQKLDLQLLFQIHSDLTINTVPEDEQNRFRRDDDQIEVGDEEYTYHIPPSESFLNREIGRLIAYANDELHDSRFTHPIIKAIIIHFWIGYLHPFTDGNGRLARALFYWYVLKKKYWVFQYLSLSSVIRQSPVQYWRSYVYSEQDDNDLTYFIDYNLRKIQQAQREFEDYFDRKKKQTSQIPEEVRTRRGFNIRQVGLLIYLHRNPNQSITYGTHGEINGVTRLTSAKDIRRLEDLGYIDGRKIGRVLHFFPTDKLAELFDN